MKKAKAIKSLKKLTVFKAQIYQRAGMLLQICPPQINKNLSNRHSRGKTKKVLLTLVSLEF